MGGQRPTSVPISCELPQMKGRNWKAIQAPHTLAAGRFHPVRLLELPHNLKVPAPM